MNRFRRYAPKYGQEMFELVDAIERKLDQYEYVNDLNNTITLARCFLISIISLIQSAYQALEIRNLLGHRVLARSLLDYTVDLMYIALHKDTALNDQFVNYCKLFLYWTADEIKSFPGEIPRLKREYKEYVRVAYPDVVNKAENVLGDDSAKLWHEIDRKMNKYRKGWTGLNFHEKVSVIEKMMGGPDTAIPGLRYFFKTLSNYTHPTPYSAVPHFSPRDCSFKFYYDFTDEALREAEEMLFSLLEFSVRGFAQALGGNRGLELHEFFKQQTKSCPNILSWLFPK